MKRILAIILMAIATMAIADDLHSQGDFRTLKFALTQARWKTPNIQNKVINTLARYQFSTDTPTPAMTNAVLAQFNFTGFVATVNTNIAVYVYDYSLPKARPNERDSMSHADLLYYKSLVDDDPQITIDVIRRSQTEAWYAANGISHKAQEQP